MGFFDDIYVAYSEECPMTFLVTRDYEKILSFIEEDWRNSGWELSAQEHADTFKINHYIPLTKVKQYIDTHKGYVPALMNTAVPLARKEYGINAVETVDFYLKVRE